MDKMEQNTVQRDVGGRDTIQEAKYYLSFLRIQPSEFNKYIFNPNQSNLLGDDSGNRDLWLLRGGGRTTGIVEQGRPYSSGPCLPRTEEQAHFVSNMSGFCTLLLTSGIMWHAIYQKRDNEFSNRKYSSTPHPFQSSMLWVQIKQVLRCYVCGERGWSLLVPKGVSVNCKRPPEEKSLAEPLSLLQNYYHFQ